MSTESPAVDNGRKHFGSFLTAFVVLSLYLMLFQITSISRSMAFAFNIPIHNVGIYFSKLFGFYDFSTTIGSGIEIIIYESVKHTSNGNGNKTSDLVRKYISVIFFVLILITRLMYLLLLYRSNNKAYHFYILSCVEGIFFGFFQIPYFALASQYSASNTLSINASNLLVFLIQSLLEFIMSSNHIKMVRIHGFIVLNLTIISNGLWPYFRFGFDTDFPKKDEKKSESKKTTCTLTVGSSTSALLATSSSSSQSSLLYVSELTIIEKIIIELKDICSCCTHLGLSISIRTCISMLEGITSCSQIDYELLVALDMIILGIQKDNTQNCLLLKQLVLFLRIRIHMNISSRDRTRNSVVALGHSQLLTVSCSGTQETQTQNENCGSDEFDHFGKSMSRFLMFHIPSFFKDFLFPAVLPYGLLELNKCRIINILIPIFNITGYMTTFILTEIDESDGHEIGFKKWDEKWDIIWLLLIPIVVVYFCSLMAIHSNIRFFKAIVNFQWRVILMVLLLFLSFTFLESVSYSGVANYVFACPKDKQPLYIMYCHNISCMLFPYLFGKLSVGYNDVRISSGYVLPNFRPAKGLKNTFCYWFKNTFTHAFKDIGKDFRLSIREYL